MDVFAWIDGHKRAQKPAFPFQMNDGFGHIGLKAQAMPSIL
jgi:hypothetical protein